MTISYGGFNSFRLRQLASIPITRLCEVACEIAYDTLLKDPELLEKTIKKYSVRTPERQLEIDLERGYERVVDQGNFGLDKAYILWYQKCQIQNIGDILPMS